MPNQILNNPVPYVPPATTNKLAGPVQDYEVGTYFAQNYVAPPVQPTAGGTPTPFDNSNVVNAVS